MITSAILITAYLLDTILGEVKRFHPLVGFGFLTTFLEKLANSFHPKNAHPKNTPTNEHAPNKKVRLEPDEKWRQRVCGTLSWIILCIPLPLIYFYVGE